MIALMIRELFILEQLRVVPETGDGNDNIPSPVSSGMLILERMRIEPWK